MKPLKPDKGSGNKTPQAPGKAALQTEKSGTEPTPPRKRGRRLRTISHVKQGLAHNVREIEAGRRDPMTGNSVTNGLRTLADVMMGDVAKEIAELRELLGLGEKPLGERPVPAGRRDDAFTV